MTDCRQSNRLMRRIMLRRSGPQKHAKAETALATLQDVRRPRASTTTCSIRVVQFAWPVLSEWKKGASLFYQGASRVIKSEESLRAKLLQTSTNVADGCPSPSHK